MQKTWDGKDYLKICFYTIDIVYFCIYIFAVLLANMPVASVDGDGVTVELGVLETQSSKEGMRPQVATCQTIGTSSPPPAKRRNVIYQQKTNKIGLYIFICFIFLDDNKWT